MKKIAIPIWDGRVSPVMDTACRLLIVDLDGSREVSRTTLDIPQTHIADRVSYLVNAGIDVLICGAISHQFEQMLVASGIKPYPWFRGNVDEIVVAYSNGIFLHDGNFQLPGCGHRQRQGRGRRCGQRLGRGRYKQVKEDG